MISFVLALPVGLFFLVVKGWLLLPLLLVGAACVLFYSPFIYRTGFSEFTAGLGLGTLPVLGAYYVQSGLYSPATIFASIPSGILVCNLLFLNEFPDADADRIGKRKTIPIMFGKPKSTQIYLILNVLCYTWVIGGVLLKLMPPGALLALLSLPLAVKAVKGAFHFDEEAKMVPAQAANVMVVLLTQLLLGIGYLLGRDGCPIFG